MVFTLLTKNLRAFLRAPRCGQYLPYLPPLSEERLQGKNQVPRTACLCSIHPSLRQNLRSVGPTHAFNLPANTISVKVTDSRPEEFKPI